MAYEAWRYGNPQRVYERIELQEQAKAARTPAAKAQRAAQKIKEQFKEPPDVKDNR